LTKDPDASRREFVGGVLAGALTLSGGAAAAEPRPLKEVAARKGILFGSAVGNGTPGTQASSFHDPRYLQIVRRDCSVIVPENELKAYTIAPARDRYDFARGDEIAAFARSHGIRLRGHNLLWNQTKYMPKWLVEWLGSASPQEAEHYLRNYIQQVCAHYGTQIHSWDVVNETINPDTGQFFDSPFTRLFDIDALRIAFEAAREAAPRAQLVYNDYMSWRVRDEPHRTGVLRLLEKLKARNVPVNALGVQSHLQGRGADYTAQAGTWKAFVDEVAGMGYGLLITELDVSDKEMPGDIRQRDAEVAALTRDYLDMMLSYPSLNQVLCWGMVDRYSWWLYEDNTREDKAPMRPCPYDEGYQPKPMREAIAASLAAAAPRATASHEHG
jgi:endo-1,4-beta-xylanase